MVCLGFVYIYLDKKTYNVCCICSKRDRLGRNAEIPISIGTVLDRAERCPVQRSALLMGLTIQVIFIINITYMATLHLSVVSFKVMLIVSEVSCFISM